MLLLSSSSPYEHNYVMKDLFSDAPKKGRQQDLQPIP